MPLVMIVRACTCAFPVKLDGMTVTCDQVGDVRSQVERHISDEVTVVVDSAVLGIKGVRYELYTRAMTARTAHCTVFVDHGHCVNAVNSLERPNDNARWDRPVIVAGKDVAERVRIALQAPPGPMIKGTQARSVDITMASRLDAETRRVIIDVAAHRITLNQERSPAQCTFTIEITRHLPHFPVHRLRRDFVRRARAHETDDYYKVFVTFLNDLPLAAE